jgi:two-component SAPR family response regulator
MKALIIEDEMMAAKALQKLIGEVSPDTVIVDVLESIEESVEWLENNPMPDLMFLDIHLADGSSFAIFERVNVTCPVIFTTAYDEFALKAFEVNSLDYLLKPISREAALAAKEYSQIRFFSGPPVSCQASEYMNASRINTHSSASAYSSMYMAGSCCS